MKKNCSTCYDINASSTGACLGCFGVYDSLGYALYPGYRNKEEMERRFPIDPKIRRR